MKYLGLFIKEVIKGIIVLIILGAIAIYFFPNKITVIILMFLLLGVIGAASDSVKKAKTEESKSRLRESFNSSSDTKSSESQNIISNRVNVIPKQDSIFDDIELD